MMMIRALPPCVWGGLLACSLPVLGQQDVAGDRAGYDPLQVAAAPLVKVWETTLRDPRRSRDIPLKAYLPQDENPAPVVLFSHGLGGNRHGSAFLGKHWAARGYAAIFLQHPGSDESVWRDIPPLQRMEALREAASAENFQLRCEDVVFVLDALNSADSQLEMLRSRVDLEHVGMSGHSFGAVTTQAVAGQAYPWVGQRSTDRRIDAAVIMSPSSPLRGSKQQAFGQVKVPWLLMTGTHDSSPIGQQTIASRREVFPYLPSGIDRFELVLDGAEHSAFTERPLPGERRQRNPNHHRAILAISTAFWDAYLREDDAARQWLRGSGPQSVLQAGDLWSGKSAEGE